MMLHFKSVHEPFYGPERYQWLYKGEKLPEPEDLLWEESPKNKVFRGWPLEILMNRFLDRPQRYAPPHLELETEDPDKRRRATYQKFIKDYLRGVAGIDDNIGRVMEYLERTGQAEETIVIYTSDQGYFLGEHNMFDKRFMLEESARMPFIIRYPKEIEPGTTVDDIILNIDFAELILDYANAEIPGYMQGRSFRENLMGKTPEDWREAMYYHYWTHQERRPSHYGIRTNKYKLIYYYGLQRMGHQPDSCWELYNLEKDPHELVNVYNKPQYDDVINRLKVKLKTLRKKYEDTEDPLDQ
jgi:arylsulfatase A-like enzyme